MSHYSPLRFGAGLVAALLGVWFVFWPPGPLDESPLYAVGPLLLALGSVVTAKQLSLRPIADLEQRVAPAEVDVWISLACIGVAIAWVLLNASTLMEGWSLQAAGHVGSRLVMVLVFLIVVSSVMRSRRGNAVTEDERDRLIERRALEWGHGALVAGVIGIMVMLGFSLEDKLQWITPPAVATLLAFALLWGWLVGAVAKVGMYLWDRRGA